MLSSRQMIVDPSPQAVRFEAGEPVLVDETHPADIIDGRHDPEDPYRKAAQQLVATITELFVWLDASENKDLAISYAAYAFKISSDIINGVRDTEDPYRKALLQLVATFTELFVWLDAKENKELAIVAAAYALGVTAVFDGKSMAETAAERDCSRKLLSIMARDICAKLKLPPSPFMASNHRVKNERSRTKKARHPEIAG